MNETKAVVYVDLLGFSALTEACPVDADDFAVLDRPNKEDFLRVKLESVGNNRLIEHYMKFNMAVDHAVEWQLLSHPDLTAITFSDSAFIAADSVYTAVCLAKAIVTKLIREQIPVRCGIAYGSFLVLRFRSDLSLRAGTHAAQFLGTAVVWAHAAAELSRIKGLRILLHRSAVDVMGEREHRAPVPQLEHRKLPLVAAEAQNAAGAIAEVNFLNAGPNNRDEEVWQNVLAMRAAAPASAQMHYRATLESINRMRLALSRDALTSAAVS